MLKIKYNAQRCNVQRDAVGWVAHDCLMLKIKHNAQRCNVQRGDVSRHVLFSYSCMICFRTG